MLTESEIKSYTVDIPADIQTSQRASGCASVTGSAAGNDLEKSHEMARREADELWSLVDEYTAMADRAEKRAEDAWEKLQESKPPQNDKVSDPATR